MKYIVNILRILVGALFIFSGFVKAVDPLGTSYKMHEYFEAFAPLGLNAFWEWMNTVSTPFAVFMIVIEMAAGLALLTGWMPKFTVWVLFLMTLFFTLLTGFTYLSGYCPGIPFAIHSISLIILFMVSAAKFNSPKGKKVFWITVILTISFVALLKTPSYFHCEFTETKMKVTDCGCFGDFMKLKPWETFYKDIVLDVLIFILVIGVGYIKPLVKPKANNLIIGGGTLASLLFCFSNYIWGLPIVDFRPYKIGNNINEQRKTLKPEVRKMVFIYKNKKTNETKSFTTEEVGNVTDDWDFVDRKDSIIDPGIPAKINNLYISDEDGNDITDTLLTDKNYSFMVVIYKMTATDKEAITGKLNPLSEQCEKAGIKFYAVCGGDMKVDDFRHELNTAYPFYTADETPLKTIIRSNPGLVLLKDGVVIDMWHHKHLPDWKDVNEKYFKK
ncbi:MAG: DoxX family protein [Bacteroidota bacterium]